MGRGLRSKHKLPYCDECEHRISQQSVPDLRARTDAFLLAVQDPARPQCCRVCFMLMTEDLYDCPDAIDEFKQQKNHLFAVCLEIVDALEREPISRVRQSLSNAQSACPKHRFFVDGKDVFVHFVAEVFHLLSIGLVNGSRTLEAYPLSSKKAHWPTSLDQMFPAGVERGVDVLIYWCCAAADPFHPLLILLLYMHSATAVVLPVVMSPPRRERLAWAMVQAMSPKLVAWPGGVPPFCPRDSLSTSFVRRGTPIVVQRIVDTINFISTCGRTHSDTDSDLLRLIAGLEVPFLVAAERAKTALPQLTARQGEVLVSFAALLRARLTHNDTAPPRPTALLVFEYARRAAIPANAFCTCGAQQISASGTRRFFVCATCRLVRYCHRDCQREDWKAGHKQLCPVLSRLFARWQSVAGDRDIYDWDIFQRAWAQCALDEAEVTLLRNWVVASGKVPAISLQ